MALSLEEFLKLRGISEESSAEIKNENIDEAAIQIMDEATLMKYIPKLGDRVAIRDFCKRKMAPKKVSLIERLREKLSAKESKPKIKESQTVPTKLTRKLTRKIELGLMTFSPLQKKTIQVRLSKGGGTRTIIVNRHSKADEILRTARNLFFPNNESKCLGNINEYETILLDFCKNEVDINLTVEEMYDTAKVNKLRFYLSLHKKDENTHSDYGDLQLSDEGDDGDEGNISMRLRCNVNNDYQEASTSSDFIASQSTAFFQEENDIDLQFSDEGDDRHTLTELSSNFNNDLQEASTSSGIIASQSTEISTYFSSFIDEELLAKSPPTLLLLHRGKVFEELLTAFKHHCDLNNIQIEMILPNGQREVAEDMGGVLRDALSEFWQVFYEKCTVGTTLKVPCLRDDFGYTEWEAVARIIGIGWTEQRYFPICLAPTFIMNTLGYEFNDDDVINDFLKFVSESEAEMLRNAMSNFDDTDIGEMLDFFSNFDAKRLVTKNNFKTVLLGVAQKELIQKPEFVSKCFSRTGELKKVSDMKYIYSACLPTPKNILGRLRISEKNPSQEIIAVFNYLKKFIREADAKTRSAFLRFATGSDIVNHDMSIRFNETSGFSRSPVAHTCSCILELPKSYENFVAFRSEFNNVLSSNIWVMDII